MTDKTMNLKKPGNIATWSLFLGLAAGSIVLNLLFLVNVFQWANAPDKGWRSIAELGPDIVGTTTPIGEKTGLRTGDKIVSLNGQPYETYQELAKILKDGVGELNIYVIERDGINLTINIVSQKLGLKRAMLQSGTFWALGAAFMAIGIIVFLMKPFHETSWPFLVMTTVMGPVISYLAPSYLFIFNWMEYVPNILAPFLAATIIHLAGTFPTKIALFTRWRRGYLGAYFLSSALAILLATTASGEKVIDFSPTVRGVIILYCLASIVFFLAINVHRLLRSKSVAVRLQTILVFTGFAAALLLPLIEMFSMQVLKVALFPNPVFFYFLFLLIFPISIGYAIVKHDLFAIDVFIRRAYGYILSTSAIVGIYAALLSGINVFFQGRDITGSPLFSIAFALTVVFLFQPLHRNIQGFVDRVFYRQKYDYRKTIREISEAMIRIFDPVTIQKTLVGAAVREMFLQNGLLMMKMPVGDQYETTFSQAGEKPAREITGIQASDAIINVLDDKGDALFRHEVELNPIYESSRDSLEETFDSLGSEVMLPLKYKDEMIGIVSLGGKKSGKMFSSEDLDLLRTLVNQGSVALENARLFEENLEKGRMEEELKIAHELQASMLPESSPALEGFSIAARCISAREVGGDFYDFVDIVDEKDQKGLGIIVADVSGKAVSGALVMAASRSIFRILAGEPFSVNRIMGIANSRLRQDISKGMFVALLYAVLEPHTGTVTFCSAGQTQPILCPADGSEPVFLETEGDRFPLGIVPDCDYRERKVHLLDGDRMVLYTDGIVEAVNSDGDMYGFERFLELIDKHREGDAEYLLDTIIEDVTEFAGDVEQHDDITVVVIDSIKQTE